MPEPDRRSPLVALRHRNFRLLWCGQLVSMAGSMMQSAAILWHVSLLVSPERKGLALGLVGALPEGSRISRVLDLVNVGAVVPIETTVDAALGRVRAPDQ